jgi:hypothetical protein
VALPRMKVAPAIPARLGTADADARREVHRTEERRRVVDMMVGNWEYTVKSRGGVVGYTELSPLAS